MYHGWRVIAKVCFYELILCVVGFKDDEKVGMSLYEEYGRKCETKVMLLCVVRCFVPGGHLITR